MQRPSAPTLAVMAVSSIPLPLHLIDAHKRHHSAASQRVHAAAAVARPAQDSSSAQAPATPAAATTTTTTTPATTTSTGAIGATTTTSTTTTTTAAPPSPAAAAKPAANGQSSAKRHDLVLTVRRAGHRAHAAGDPGVTIVDYSFSPSTVTVHVGDTITWSNSGKQPHTATANDHSFDTGILNHGKSASHTFTQAGTFAYICSVHPYMHGTVVVEASSTSSQSGGGSGSGASSGSNASSASSGSGSSGSGTSGSSGSSDTPAATAAQTTGSSGSTLPVTGLSLVTLVFAGAVLIGGGIFLRRRARL